jgi:signal transduction histidine kinase
MSIAIPRLRLVLVTAVILLTLFVTTMVSWLFIVQYKEKAITHFHHYALTVAENVVSAETESIITENYASLQDSIVYLLKGAHIESITITTPAGIIIADTHPEHLGDSFTVSDERKQLSNHGNTLLDFETSLAETLFPIQIGETLIGWSIIRLDISYIQENIVAIQKKTIIVAGITILVSSMLIFFFSAAITRPLEEIMVATANVADGNFDQQAKVAGVYEIRKLAEVFNIMTLAIKQREARLRQAQKMEAIGVLSSSIAHEFGNPLVGISLFLRGLKESAQLSQGNQRLLELCLDECSRMSKLLRDLKYFYQPSSEEKRPINLHLLLDNILLFQKSYLQALHIEVVKEYGKSVLEVMAVEDQIKQVFVNLLLNAAESMAETGGSLTISTDTKDNIVSVKIQDTGIGINLENQKEIFTPFFSTKHEITGTGLGLSVSYGIVQSHQGDIKVSSSPGQGTTFLVTLPIV